MDILRIDANNFLSSDKLCTYAFEIKGFEAILFANTDKHIPEVIEKFLFYSGFISRIVDENSVLLYEKEQDKPYLYELAKIQPSQFYVSRAKLESVKKWIKSNKDIMIPVLIKDGQAISLDGHTRMKAAAQLSYTHVYIYPDEYDNSIFDFVEEAKKRHIYSVFDMEILDSKDYELKWDKFCDDFFAAKL